MTSLAIAHLLEQVHLRPLPPVCPPPAIVGPTLRPLPRDLVAQLAGRRAAERAGDGQAWFRRHRSRSFPWQRLTPTRPAPASRLRSIRRSYRTRTAQAPALRFRPGRPARAPRLSLVGHGVGRGCAPRATPPPGTAHATGTLRRPRGGGPAQRAPRAFEAHRRSAGSGNRSRGTGPHSSPSLSLLS